MQALFIGFIGNEIARVDVLHTVSGTDLNATARALMEEHWAGSGQYIDLCRIYLVQNKRLILGGDEVCDKKNCGN